MSLSKFSLEGKKALVVGARRNMGKAFAKKLTLNTLDIEEEAGDLEIFLKRFLGFSLFSKFVLGTITLY